MGSSPRREPPPSPDANPAVFFYISGHGFGHAARQIEIVNALGTARPATSIVIRTSVPRWLFDRTVRVPITFLPGPCDTGVVQIDSLELDAQATIRLAGDFHSTFAERTDAEARLLRDHAAKLVISDAPALGCAAAAAAAIPSVVVSNFTWDWIYEEYAEQLGDAPGLLPSIRDAYARADAAWRLPMHGGFATFREIVDVPFVARHATHARADVRRALKLPGDETLVLSSFGGYGVRSFDATTLDCLDRYQVVLTRGELGPTAPDVANGVRGLHYVREADLYGAALRYEDLVAAVDVVVTKPGYGIISECIANGAAMLYTSRGRFPEYEILVRDMPRFLRCQFIDQQDLLAGRWRRALDVLMALGAPPERPRTDGAQVVAERVLHKIEA